MKTTFYDMEVIDDNSVLSTTGLSYCVRMVPLLLSVGCYKEEAEKCKVDSDSKKESRVCSNVRTRKNNYHSSCKYYFFRFEKNMNIV